MRKLLAVALITAFVASSATAWTTRTDQYRCYVEKDVHIRPYTPVQQITTPVSRKPGPKNWKSRRVTNKLQYATVYFQGECMSMRIAATGSVNWPTIGASTCPMRFTPKPQA